MNTAQTIEIKFTGHGEYGIHHGFFNGIAVIEGKEYGFQCCTDDECQSVIFNDCGYNWGVCADVNEEIAKVIGWEELLSLLERAYKLYMIEKETTQPELTEQVFTGWWGDADDGETYTSQWASTAEDDQGNEYQIIYEFELIKGQEPEADELPWNEDHIVEIIAL